MAQGPLVGLRVVELGGIGPAPLACMILADLGADVVRVDRAEENRGPVDYTHRGRRIMTADLKSPSDLERVITLVDHADVLVEGFRPGVTERLGLGPEECMARNPRLVYGRMTGWGQEGPLAATAGHDINYISVTGVLENIGRSGERPVPPLNLVGDYGGGAMFLVAGVLAALFERQGSGLGQVVDAAMCDGASVLATLMWSMRGTGAWFDERGRNLLDGSRPYYDTYLCADGRSMAVGCIEPQFFAVAARLLGLDPVELPDQHDQTRADELRAAFAAAFASKTMAEWTEIFAGTDACVTPVLTYAEALDHEHLRDRGTFTELDGVPQPRPAPRFSRTPGAEPSAPRRDDEASWPPRAARINESRTHARVHE
ncbi:CaiB/BaiF CoA-transferase family protein [Actinomadura sp. 7K507]|uniref:CaiB/BaiF CoA transferase family protein n=1 Tax=Actinomadura sp. 7K507 TaxID=2530365 RepID=UPI00104F603C|nr:CaiB/BaiF CoA-transferase family protein [Actinomadura sp. 7K507]TDC88532.1 CoA transferase [Actinomadura sp. 7K507]